MRVVFVNRIAWPDEGATAIYLTDVAEACARAGHETHVVCGEAGYRAAGKASREPAAFHRGVRYHRIPGRRGSGTLDRALASAAFLARVALEVARLPRPDVVVALTDPPFVDVVAGAIGRLRGARTVHWLMDLYPDIAVAAGVLRKGGAAERLLGAVMGASLRRASAVVVLGRGVRRPLLARGVSRRRVRVIENWAPAEVEKAAASGLTPPAGRPLTLMYSGNYGVAHDLSPLLERLRTLAPGAPVRLVLQASGARVQELRRAVEGLPVPVEWREPVPVAGLAASLRDADVHVVSVRAGFEGLVVPSKAYAPWALGLPVLWLGGADTGADAAGPGPGPLAKSLFSGLKLAAPPPEPQRRTRGARLGEWVALIVERARRRGPPA